MIHTPAGSAPVPGPAYLEPTRFFDWDAPVVRDFATRAIAGAATDVERAVKLFYAVRDGWRYDPFSMTLDPNDYVASVVVAREAAYCIPKAILLVAAARAAGIHAGIGLSDVVNHLTTEKLKARMGGKTYFMHHGYAVLHLGGRWVKAAPAFNLELCQRFHVRPTEFDGTGDAVFQEFDALHRRHMEYVKDHGVWSDFPFERVDADFRAFYPVDSFMAAAPGERFEDGRPVS
ncbi:MAG: transglutaminase family protein [Burkholderiales bacterium]|jgi:transglutaminase-like putative cysteine protease|nr:transglutaminase family protein [Burkholderiales bacterium]